MWMFPDGDALKTALWSKLSTLIPAPPCIYTVFLPKMLRHFGTGIIVPLVYTLMLILSGTANANDCNIGFLSSGCEYLSNVFLHVNLDSLSTWSIVLVRDITTWRSPHRRGSTLGDVLCPEYVTPWWPRWLMEESQFLHWQQTSWESTGEKVQWDSHSSLCSSLWSVIQWFLWRYMQTKPRNRYLRPPCLRWMWVYNFFLRSFSNRIHTPNQCRNNNFAFF